MLAAEVREHGAVHTDWAKVVGVEEGGSLIGRDGFGETDDGIASVVDDDVKPASLLHGSIYGSIDGSFVGDIKFQNMDRKILFLCESLNLGYVFGVLAVGIAHGSEDGVTFARERFGEQTSQASAGPGDQNYLFVGHVVSPSLDSSAWMLRPLGVDTLNSTHVAQAFRPEVFRLCCPHLAGT